MILNEQTRSMIERLNWDEDLSFVLKSHNYTRYPSRAYFSFFSLSLSLRAHIIYGMRVYLWNFSFQTAKYLIISLSFCFLLTRKPQALGLLSSRLLAIGCAYLLAAVAASTLTKSYERTKERESTMNEWEKLLNLFFLLNNNGLVHSGYTQTLRNKKVRTWLWNIGRLNLNADRIHRLIDKSQVRPGS